MDLSFFDQWEFAAFDDEFNAAQHKHSGATIGYDVEPSPSSESYSSYAELRAQKTAKTSSWSSSAATTTTTTELNSAPLRDATASGPKILSFGHPDSTFHSNLSAALEVIPMCGSNSKRSYDAMVGLGPKSKRGRTASNNQEHILAERKRREKLSQRFIALSAIVPGLKKVRKTNRDSFYCTY